jgi:hypothetical protein
MKFAQCLASSAILKFLSGMTGTTSAYAAAPVKLVTEEAMVASPQPGIKIYVRNKRPANQTHFDAAHTLVFVHGATYRSPFRSKHSRGWRSASTSLRPATLARIRWA